MKIYISHASSYDYREELYRPLKSFFKDHELFLPHEGDNSELHAKDVLPTCELLLAEVSFPSTGQGIELGVAHMLNKPVLCIHKVGARPSSSLKYITDKIVEYKNLSDILPTLQIELARIESA